MHVELLYYTPNYHKLVEYAARNCYDSFGKCDEESHKLVPAIMNKGHLSISGHGNIVFGVTVDKSYDLNDYLLALEDVVLAKEYNNFIRWTQDPDSQFDFVLSFNILTFMETFLRMWEENQGFGLTGAIVKRVGEVPVLRWFYDRSVKLEPSVNPYLQIQYPDLLSPVVLVSDYEALKSTGKLTDYELEYHSTATVEIVSDRAMSLQDARHKDMMARSEISQRYVSFEGFDYRVPNGVDPNEEMPLYVYDDGKWHTIGANVTYAGMMDIIRSFYKTIYEHQVEKGVPKLRAKEQARSVLPNAVLSRYIDTRPLRQWKHFFKLRNDVHAQNEKQDDARALLEAFKQVGVTFC